MKERPIRFNDDMVRAILRGGKTQTRRIVKHNKESFLGWNFSHLYSKPRGILQIAMKKPDLTYSFPCPYGAVGDRLWVRETWKTWKEFDNVQPRQISNQAEIQYPSTYDGWDSRKRQSIYMPRWASRIDLLIKDISVEKLQDISNEDAKAEGVSPLFSEKELERSPDCYIDPMPFANYLWHGHIGRTITNRQSDAWAYQFSSYSSARDSFSSLWESINGQGSWDANPYVWVIEFERIKP